MNNGPARVISKMTLNPAAVRLAVVVAELPVSEALVLPVKGTVETITGLFELPFPFPAPAENELGGASSTTPPRALTHNPIPHRAAIDTVINLNFRSIFFPIARKR